MTNVQVGKDRHEVESHSIVFVFAIVCGDCTVSVLAQQVLVLVLEGCENYLASDGLLVFWGSGHVVTLLPERHSIIQEAVFGVDVAQVVQSKTNRIFKLVLLKALDLQIFRVDF